MRNRLFPVLSAALLIFLSTSVFAGRFSDVKEGDWFAPAVEYVTEKQLFTGVSDNQFSPQTPMTRAMFVTVLARMSQGEPTSGASVFSDVPMDSWYGPSVMWAWEKQIVTGVDETQFAPNTPISREQMAVILYRYLNAMEIHPEDSADAPKTFQDASSISSYAKEAVDAMRRWGLLTGDNNGNFAPANSATRAECAAMLMRLHKSFSSQLPSASLKLETTSVLLGTGRTMTLSVSGSPTSWTSDNTSVATVSAQGVVTGAAPGSCYITVSDGQNQRRCLVRVVDSTTPTASPYQTETDSTLYARIVNGQQVEYQQYNSLGSLWVSTPPTLRLSLGGNSYLSLEPYYTFSSSNEAVASG